MKLAALRSTYSLAWRKKKNRDWPSARIRESRRRLQPRVNAPLKRRSMNAPDDGDDDDDVVVLIVLLCCVAFCCDDTR